MVEAVTISFVTVSDTPICSTPAGETYIPVTAYVPFLYLLAFVAGGTVATGAGFVVGCEGVVGVGLLFDVVVVVVTVVTEGVVTG